MSLPQISWIDRASVYPALITCFSTRWYFVQVCFGALGGLPGTLTLIRSDLFPPLPRLPLILWLRRVARLKSWNSRQIRCKIPVSRRLVLTIFFTLPMCKTRRRVLSLLPFITLSAVPFIVAARLAQDHQCDSEAALARLSQVRAQWDIFMIHLYTISVEHP